jgi:hypothetical protein
MVLDDARPRERLVTLTARRGKRPTAAAVTRQVNERAAETLVIHWACASA